MKKIVLVIFSALALSCSSDDNGNIENTIVIPENPIENLEVNQNDFKSVYNNDHYDLINNLSIVNTFSESKQIIFKQRILAKNNNNGAVSYINTVDSLIIKGNENLEHDLITEIFVNDNYSFELKNFSFNY